MALIKENSLDNLSDQHQVEDSNKKKENPAACVFVASLNKHLEDQELHDSVLKHFKQWGQIIGVKVFKDWLKRPYAFVQYENISHCKLALKEAPGTILNGRSIRCEPARVNRSICLISLNQPFHKKHIQDTLSTFGEIEDITILQPHGKFHSIFIKYRYRDDALKAYMTLKFSDHHSISKLIQQNQWFIEWASNLDDNNLHGVCGISCRLDKLCIFVGNLPESTSQHDLHKEFDKFGTITNIHLIRKPYHRPTIKKVFAFIKYKSEKEASDAIEHENGKLYKDDKIIRVCFRQYPFNSCKQCNNTTTFINDHHNNIMSTNNFYYSPPMIEDYSSVGNTPFMYIPSLYPSYLQQNMIPFTTNTNTTATASNNNNNTTATTTTTTTPATTTVPATTAPQQDKLSTSANNNNNNNQSSSSSSSSSTTSLSAYYPNKDSFYNTIITPFLFNNNPDYTNGYYMDPYPTMVYYTYPPPPPPPPPLPHSTYNPYK
ncbi:uncharacterized protein BX663DRAFT_131085 [Cokeromyces recurvatus]|uniref:uncharacterized protein n=1 Tax=Cokeromyces recurvatus TaxID=90255 RepID=UPI00221EACCC|nr:uncharacterized protein BX663DRAFT_131085 [Cokeromyces recurvatus]KAI7907186.1 hypothetical protein BX663DRAFT_131085 [Cokeromyces recurvatus]